MSAPILHRISQFNSAFHGVNLKDGWGIPSAKSDDVIWIIVLAYLNSSPPSNLKELAHRIKSLAGRQTVNENIKNSLKICNPFLHQNACFCDETMSTLVSIFKERVNDYIEGDKNIYKLGDESLKYLQASSCLLSCNIVLVSFPLQNPTSLIGFPLAFGQNPIPVYPKNIVLLFELKFTNGNENARPKFTYCIPKEIGIVKQRQALAEILHRAISPNKKVKMIQKICYLPDVGDNFIISLLKNDFVQIIPFIYKSPYVLSKLADAGFETDPRTKDSAGRSAFSHALETEESQLVSILYDHAANACLLTDASVRSPDPVIVENLMCLKNHLKLLEKDLESEGMSEKSRCWLRDLCRFNEFQIEMCRSINKIRFRINYYDQTQKEFEASQRKDTILVILKIYETYFNYTNGEAGASAGVDDISSFKEFYKRRDYFDKLDFCSAVMFFDNLFLLKERMKVLDNAYLDIESNFFLFIFCRKYLEKYEKEEYTYFVSRWITFYERLSLQKQMCNFKKILEKTELSGDNIVGKLPEEVVRTLTNLPQIYGQFLIFRLQHYLNTATGVIVKDLKSILVIERCLQVMGECCKESDFNSIQKIIALALPKDFVKHLKQIRNKLAHIKADELLYRNILEQDLELFKGIQKELTALKRLMVPIYSAHKYELDQFLLLHSVKSVCKARREGNFEVYVNELKAILPSPEMEENQQTISTYKSQNPWKRYFDDMHSSLRTEIEDLNRNGNILDKNSIRLYKQIIQNMISVISEVLKNQKVAAREKISELESHFWCLENILTYITKDRKLSKYRRTLLYLITERKSLYSGFKLEKSTHSVGSHGGPDTEVGTVENRKSPLLEETGNICQGDVDPIDRLRKFGVLFNTKAESFASANETEDKTSSQKMVESLETNQTEEETNEEIFEDLQCIFQDQETIDTEEIGNVGVLCNAKAGGSTLANENEDKASSHEIAESPETNQTEEVISEENLVYLQCTFQKNQETIDTEEIGDVKSLNGNSKKVMLSEEIDSPFSEVDNMAYPQVEEEINEELFEDLQCIFQENQETVDTEENKEVVDLCENSQKIILSENDLNFSEMVNMSPNDWLLSNVFNVSHVYPINSNFGNPEEMMGIKENHDGNSKFNSFMEHSTKILRVYEATAQDMFQKIPEKKEKKAEFYFGNIEKYCMILKGWTILKNEEKDLILQSVPKQYQNVPELKRKVKGLLEMKLEFTAELKEELDKLNLKNREIKEIEENIELRLPEEAAAIIDSSRDYFSDLKEKLDLNEMDKKELDLMCEKLKIPDHSKNSRFILLKLVPGQNKKVAGSQFEFVRNRIRMLKRILIDDNSAIQQLWERATTPRRQMHVKEKVIQLYLNDFEVQASVETLLFDCLVILGKNELEHLWKKTANLFNGVNLRNVLAHGHPLLESLCRLLDPNDLPSELVEKMLKLISDGCVIDCMQQILEQSKTDFTGLMKIINDEDDDRFKNLREQILKCDHWKEYALLIPLDEARCV